MPKILEYIIFTLAVLLVLFGVSHFAYDTYIVFYRMYYDSSYFTKMSNSFQQFTSTWLPF